MSLVFNVAQLLKEPVGAVRRYQTDEDLGVVEGVDDHCRIQGEVELLRTGGGILATGSLVTSYRTDCSRCLEEVQGSVSLAFEEEFSPTVDLRTGVPLKQELPLDASTMDEHHELDLFDVVRQQALVSLPMQPLCRPDCAGLCPTCGHNRNVELCGCPPEVPDSAFAALRGLF
ncbi:MAG: DUF177 domain-containing protein [Chloroflexi bacterium]|nr:DUF177 domain-containing protein [Chloroflexota bacterium]